MKFIALCLAALPSIAFAQLAPTEELENPGTVSAVQERNFRMNHELTLGLGVLPLDAFYKGLSVQLGYTYHFNDSFAWQVARGLYSYNLNTGLRNQLERDFAVLPTQFPEVQYMVGSDLVWTPLYGKGAILNRKVAWFEGFVVLGASALRISEVGFRPAVNVGVGARLFTTKYVSFRFDATNNFVVSDRLLNVPTLQLSAALNFGATE